MTWQILLLTWLVFGGLNVAVCKQFLPDETDDEALVVCTVMGPLVIVAFLVITVMRCLQCEGDE